jgi:hypothetical protein
MRLPLMWVTASVVALVMNAVASPVCAQTTFPTISTRQFVGGSAKVTVSGSF